VFGVFWLGKWRRFNTSNWLRDCISYRVVSDDKTITKQIDVHRRLPMTLNSPIESGKDADAEMATKAPRGYSAAFEAIWRTHASQILCVTQRITNNREDAEDALQDSFLRAYLHLHSFDGRSSVKTWLTRIAINSALVILRKRTSAPHISFDSYDDSATHPQVVCVADGRPSPEAHYSQLEQQAMLRRSMSTLRPPIRQALELQVLEDRSVRETAEEMELSISATKSRIFQAKASLRRSVERKTGRRSRATARLQLSPA
jgi:RNA polymerase sigma-70 factor (ECF subfamily)